MNIFNTIGITRPDTSAGGQIRGGWTFKGDEMPPSNSVVTPPNDAADDVPLRMPDTTGVKANLAEYRAQVIELETADQKAFTRLHFFGTATDGSMSGTYTLRYTDQTTATVTLNFPDWCGSATAPAHPAIGPQTGRYTPTGSDGAACSIYHVNVANPQPAKTLFSVTLPAAPTSGNARGYLMALTLEEAGGAFRMPNLAGVNPFPNDSSAPQSTVTVGGSPATSGWYTTAPRITITGTDETGGSGVEQIQYRVNGGAPQFYTGAFDLKTEGKVKFEYRAIDRAGNAENYKTVEMQVDPSAPATSASTFPTAAALDWNDREVTVGLRAGDGTGSGTTRTEYRVNGAAWTEYKDAFTVAGSGTQLVEYRSHDAAGNVEAAKSLDVHVDTLAPKTSLLINAAAPFADYIGTVRVAFTRTDGDDSSGVVGTEYRIDEGEWTAYEGSFDLPASRIYTLDFRSWDLVGNVENFQRARVTVRAPTVQPAPPAQAPPATAPKPFAALGEVALRLRTLSALRAGRLKVDVSCQGVSRGTLALTVDRATARKLKLKSSTLARKTLDCGDEGRATVSLKPSSTVRRALSRTKSSVRAKLTLRMTGAPADTQSVTLKGKS